MYRQLDVDLSIEHLDQSARQVDHHVRPAGLLAGLEPGDEGRHGLTIPLIKSALTDQGPGLLRSVTLVDRDRVDDSPDHASFQGFGPSPV